MNSSQTSAMAASHQPAGSRNRLHASRRQAIQAPVRPATGTETFTWAEKRRSMASKSAKRRDGSSNAAMAGRITAVTKATPPIQWITART